MRRKPNARIEYFVYNKSAKAEPQNYKKFPKNVAVETTHAYARMVVMEKMHDANLCASVKFESVNSILDLFRRVYPEIASFGNALRNKLIDRATSADDRMLWRWVEKHCNFEDGGWGSLQWHKCYSQKSIRD